MSKSWFEDFSNLWGVTTMEDDQEQKEIAMTQEIAAIFSENRIDSRHAEPILWKVLSSVYRLLKKKYGISKDEIAVLLDVEFSRHLQISSLTRCIY